MYSSSLLRRYETSVLKLQPVIATSKKIVERERINQSNWGNEFNITKKRRKCSFVKSFKLSKGYKVFQTTSVYNTFSEYTNRTPFASTSL